MRAFLLLVALALAPWPATAQPAGWRASSEAFGLAAEVEVRGLDAATAEEALRAATGELADAEGQVAALTLRLNAAAGSGPVPATPLQLALLGRALEFCLWSEGAHGPLGGLLYELWRRAVPPAASLRAAVETAGCDRLRLDLEAGTAEIAAGSRLDLRGFAPGWAIDRAVEALQKNGAGNARVRLGAIQRAFGGGPADAGWPAELALPADWVEPLGRLALDDSSLAVAGREPPLVVGGDSYPPHINLRLGRPARGTVATLVVSELALDAQALATALFVLGQRDGMLRLGALRPEPSVAWLLGSGEGVPLLSTFRWGVGDGR